MSRVALYRHFDDANNLLYVGVSAAPYNRIGEHMHSSHWAERVCTVTLEWHQSRADAVKAEADAIKNEKPLFNSQRRRRNGGAIKRVGSGSDNTEIISRIERCIAETGESWSEFGKRAVNDFGLRKRLVVGSTLTPKTILRIETALTTEDAA